MDGHVAQWWNETLSFFMRGLGAKSVSDSPFLLIMSQRQQEQVMVLVAGSLLPI